MFNYVVLNLSETNYNLLNKFWKFKYWRFIKNLLISLELLRNENETSISIYIYLLQL